MYFTQEDFADFIGDGMLSGALLYGGTPTARTGSVVNGFISRSCDYVDSFLQVSYGVPLVNPPGNIVTIAMNHCKYQILLRTNDTIPAELDREVSAGESYLRALQKGTVLIPGITPNSVGSPQGGSLAVSRESDSDYAPKFDGTSLKSF
jgi:hypothetical protein